MTVFPNSNGNVAEKGSPVLRFKSSFASESLIFHHLVDKVAINGNVAEKGSLVLRFKSSSASESLIFHHLVDKVAACIRAMGFGLPHVPH